MFQEEPRQPGSTPHLPQDRALREDLLRDLGPETLLFICAVEAALEEGIGTEPLLGELPVAA
ncbi:MAG: hypothetical protein AAF411_23350 [Myxococcota bacterium]